MMHALITGHLAALPVGFWVSAVLLGLFFLCGMVIAHRMDLDAKVRKWANTIPEPVPLRTPDAPGQVTGVFRIKQRSLSERAQLKRDYVEARRRWERFCQEEDRKRFEDACKAYVEKTIRELGT